MAKPVNFDLITIFPIKLDLKGFHLAETTESDCALLTIHLLGFVIVN